MATKTIISLSSKTPSWATWTFRIVFLLTLAAVIVVSADPGIPTDIKVRVLVYLKGLDFLVWGIGKFLGQKREDFQ